MKRLMMLGAMLAAGALLATSVTGPTTATAAARTGMSTNKPTGTAAQKWANLDRVARLIDKTPKGATITISMFTLNQWNDGPRPGQQVARKLALAHKRGVNVQLVIGASKVTSEVRKLAAVTGWYDRKKPVSKQHRSWAATCNGSCRGWRAGGTEHMKAMTFSRSDGSSNVVVWMSGNLTNTAALKQFNFQRVVVSKCLYTGIRRHILTMPLDRRQGPLKSVTCGHTRFRLFPQASSADPVLAALNATPSTYHGRRAQVWVSASIWNLSGRAARLRRMHQAGATVRVVFSSDQTTDGVKAQLKAGRVPTWDSHRPGYRVHTKMAAIWNPKTRSWSTWTGSANWSIGSLLRHDELLVQQWGMRSTPAEVSWLSGVRGSCKAVKW